ncbi:MFS transporter [Paenibacillus sp. LHD-117]|uniref:MFS transporter n=1 Tax=Paenibacillus sp. LHD-117 TaxID=3071412 RepID=UPI0027E1AFD8|nr:MFS transporter [Paenibacillus sp. LHD-117]MDQ6418093.1 MFS transporter [Paenibacillus sp. LHD-117]
MNKMNKVSLTILTVAAILLVSMNMRPAITSIAPLLETIQAKLSLNSTVVSLLTAIPVICMGLFAPLAPILSRRIGFERAVSYCLILIAIATGLRYFASNALVMLASTAIIGVGLAVAGPSISGFIKKYFPQQVALMIGVYSIGIGLGASLGAGITVPLQHIFNVKWTFALAGWGLLALLSLFIWLYATKEARANISGQSNKKKFPWRNKRAILIMVFFGLQGSLNYSVTAWIVPVSQKNELSLTAAGTVITLFSLVQTATGFIIPALVSKFPNRLVWMLSSSFVTLIGLTLLSFVRYEFIPWTSAVLLGVGSGALFFLALLLPLDYTNNAEDAGAWTSMVQCGGYMIAGLGPALTGWIVDITNSYKYAFVVMSILCVFMILLCFSLYRSGDAREEITA